MSNDISNVKNLEQDVLVLDFLIQKGLDIFVKRLSTRSFPNRYNRIETNDEEDSSEELDPENIKNQSLLWLIDNYFQLHCNLFCLEDQDYSFSNLVDMYSPLLINRWCYLNLTLRFMFGLQELTDEDKLPPFVKTHPNGSFVGVDTDQKKQWYLDAAYFAVWIKFSDKRKCLELLCHLFIDLITLGVNNEEDSRDKVYKLCEQELLNKRFTDFRQVLLTVLNSTDIKNKRQKDIQIRVIKQIGQLFKECPMTMPILEVYENNSLLPEALLQVRYNSF